MGVKCRGGHRHVHLIAGRARGAAHYPAKCCRALCKGMRRQVKVDAGGLISTMIMELQDDVSDVAHVPDAWKKYWDDISGKELTPELVK